MQGISLRLWFWRSWRFLVLLSWIIIIQRILNLLWGHCVNILLSLSLVVEVFEKLLKLHISLYSCYFKEGHACSFPCLAFSFSCFEQTNTKKLYKFWISKAIKVPEKEYLSTQKKKKLQNLLTMQFSKPLLFSA